MIKLLPILLLIIGLGIGVYLLDQRTGWLSKADEDIAPQNIQISNISSNAFTVSWTTQKMAKGYVRFGEGTNLISNATALDERDNSGFQDRFTHHVTLKGLSPNTEYSYELVSNNDHFDNNNNPFSKTTAEVTDNAPPLSEPVFGKVIKSDETIPAEALVYVRLGDSLLSGFTNSSGNWLIQVNNARTADLKNYLQIHPQDNIQILVNAGPDGTDTKEIIVSQRHTSQVLTLAGSNQVASNFCPSGGDFSSSKRPMIAKGKLQDDPTLGEVCKISGQKNNCKLDIITHYKGFDSDDQNVMLVAARGKFWILSPVNWSGGYGTNFASTGRKLVYSGSINDIPEFQEICKYKPAKDPFCKLDAISQYKNFDSSDPNNILYNTEIISGYGKYILAGNIGVKSGGVKKLSNGRIVIAAGNLTDVPEFNEVCKNKPAKDPYCRINVISQYRDFDSSDPGNPLSNAELVSGYSKYLVASNMTSSQKLGDKRKLVNGRAVVAEGNIQDLGEFEPICKCVTGECGLTTAAQFKGFDSPDQNQEVISGYGWYWVFDNLSQGSGGSDGVSCPVVNFGDFEKKVGKNIDMMVPVSTSGGKDWGYVSLYYDGQLLSSGSALANGNFAWVINSGNQSGNHSLEFKVNDWSAYRIDPKGLGETKSCGNLDFTTESNNPVDPANSQAAPDVYTVDDSVKISCRVDKGIYVIDSGCPDNQAKSVNYRCSGSNQETNLKSDSCRWIEQWQIDTGKACQSQGKTSGGVFPADSACPNNQAKGVTFSCEGRGHSESLKSDSCRWIEQWNNDAEKTCKQYCMNY